LSFLSIESTGSIVKASKFKDIMPRLPFFIRSLLLDIPLPLLFWPYISISSLLSSGDANIILLKAPAWPLLGSKVTVKLHILLGPTTLYLGSILKAESRDGGGSTTKNSNLNGFSYLSNA